MDKPPPKKESKPLPSDAKNAWLEGQRDYDRVANFGIGSLTENLHGVRKVKNYLLTESDIDLITLSSLVATLGVTISISALGLAIAFCWDLNAAGVENESVAKYYIIGGFATAVLSAIFGIVGWNYRKAPKDRVINETEFYGKT